MSVPKRVQMTRPRPWRKDHPDAVIVARPSRWGNPFTVQIVKDWFQLMPPEQWREYAVKQFGKLVGADDTPHCRVIQPPRMTWESPNERPIEFTYPSRDEIRTALAGSDLACWCPLTEPCHADVLLDIANGAPK